jgi:hypothetical protein
MKYTIDNFNEKFEEVSQVMKLLSGGMVDW